MTDLNLTPEERDLAQALARDRQGSGVRIGYYVSFLAPMLSFAGYGLDNGDVLAMAIAFVGVLIFVSWGIGREISHLRVGRLWSMNRRRERGLDIRWRAAGNPRLDAPGYAPRVPCPDCNFCFHAPPFDTESPLSRDSSGSVSGVSEVRAASACPMCSVSARAIPDRERTCDGALVSRRRESMGGHNVAGPAPPGAAQQGC